MSALGAMNSDRMQVRLQGLAPMRRAALLLIWIVVLSTCTQPMAGVLASGFATAVAARTQVHTAFWPFKARHSPSIYDSLPNTVTPHPAVARIIVPEGAATAYGSGTLVDVREQFGLVVTNWHVVRDSKGVVEVVFPCGFRSYARPLKVDSNWDLAALVIWRPPVEPVKLATQPPRPGDLLTIHGYGSGQYRIATGRCTAYYAPHLNSPHEMVELDVEARQGDSGGPIFNQRGELAGVLFGAGEGTTIGSYAPRVSNFLATLAPDIGQVQDQVQVAAANRPAPKVEPKARDERLDAAIMQSSAPWTPANALAKTNNDSSQPEDQAADFVGHSFNRTAAEPAVVGTRSDTTWYEQLKSALAIFGIAAITLRLVKAVG